MRLSLVAILAFASLSMSSFIVQAAPEIGKPAPLFSAKSIADMPVNPSFYKGKIVVLEWNNPDCPFVHKHYDTENMQKLQQYAGLKGVVWIAINSSGPGKEGHLDNMQARDYIENNRLTIANYILDSDGTIGKLYGAKTTPHMFVIDQKGNLAYSGAIDDKPTPDPDTVKGARNYVREAIDALVANKPVAVKTTQSYGCFVKYAN